MTSISNSEFNKIAQDLEVHHGVFSKLWQMGKFIFDESIPTACVRFNKEGDYFGFYFNPKFYNSLDNVNRKFVVCHEAMHVILNHGKRFQTLIPQLANQTADVVINELLVKDFGFNRAEILDQEKYCWYDTVFQHRQTPIEKDRSFEFYYKELLGDAKQMAGKGKGKGEGSEDETKSPSKGQTIDQHDSLSDDADEQNQIDQKISEICDSLSDEEKEEFAEAIEKHLDEETQQNIKAGTAAGGMTKLMTDPKKIKRKSKWETVIKRWSLKYLKQADKQHEQWARINRRFVALSGMDNCFIPTEMEVDTLADEKHRIKVFFFLDTSGSCAHLADRFWAAAASLPPERFDIHLCCFDTEVYETTLESRKLYGFGGTAFSIIEDYIQKKIAKDKEKYPEAVFLITDGYGDGVRPEKPKNWHWFLSCDYKHYIPKESHTYDLKDYE
jgi:predicted metal-dependent peptidase